MTRARGRSPTEFAAVMAIGVLSLDAAAQGWPVLSTALFVVALGIYAGLVLLAGLRAAAGPGGAARAAARGALGLGGFAIVAATEVLAVRAHGAAPAVAGFVVGGLVWLVVAVGFLGATARRRPTWAEWGAETRGASLLATVGTEALAVGAA
ncbi:MAG TPA: hypothetical protein VGI54_03895, partial [Solirubrobacteraceae bacterium]